MRVLKEDTGFSELCWFITPMKYLLPVFEERFFYFKLKNAAKLIMKCLHEILHYSCDAYVP